MLHFVAAAEFWVTIGSSRAWPATLRRCIGSTSVLGGFQPNPNGIRWLRVVAEILWSTNLQPSVGSRCAASQMLVTLPARLHTKWLFGRKPDCTTHPLAPTPHGDG